MHLSIYVLIAPFIAILPTSAFPSKFELPVNHRLSYLILNTTNVHVNATDTRAAHWPVRLPFRWPVPDNPSTFLIIPSYTIPEPPPNEDEILQGLMTMAHHLGQGQPRDITNDFTLQASGVSWTLRNERTFDIRRETALVILAAIFDIEVDYGCASLTNVLYQERGFILGSFNLSITGTE